MLSYYKFCVVLSTYFLGDYMIRNKSFALIGYPLGHSLSPVIHSELFKISGLTASYKLLEIEPGKLENSVNELKKLDGFNVTIPHKTSIIPYLDNLSKKAKLFGAVNTVELKDSYAIGHNTDCIGFQRSLKGAKIALEGDVLICGCGGVSRMFAFESALAGCSINFAVREKSFPKCKELCDELEQKIGVKSRIMPISEAKGNFDLIINGTPVGMYPNIGLSPLGEEIVKSSKAVFDSIYNPEETLLLKYARESGIKHQNGLSMLVWQAAAAQEIWNGVEFNEEEINGVIDKLKVKS